MTTITKIYTITNWTNYAEVESAATAGPATVTVVDSRVGSHAVKITTFMREDGTGHELREHVI
jgi:hypothetical protein